MRECLEEFDQWSDNTSPGFKSIPMKFMVNAQLLSHQVKQYNKLLSLPADDEWKKKLMTLKPSTFETFLSFLEGIFIPFSFFIVEQYFIIQQICFMT